MNLLPTPNLARVFAISSQVLPKRWLELMMVLPLEARHIRVLAMAAIPELKA